jgi:hypothetical protein
MNSMPKPVVAKTVQEIRLNLQNSAETLRKLDDNQAEHAARNLDRLRVFLKRFVANTEEN